MSISLEKRVAALEQQLAKMNQREEVNAPAGRVWLNELYGKFAADPVFEKAMKLGRQYRKSLRPDKHKSKR